MGFISEISLVVLLPILLLAAALSWYFYKRDKQLNEIPKLARRTVVFLRFLSLSLIGFLLLGILFKYTKVREEKPILITLIDNSASLTNYADSSNVKKRISAFNKELSDKFDDSYEKVTYLVGEDFIKRNEFSLGDSKSDLSRGFEEIFSNYYNRNIGGIVFISDGNFNEGQNPVYSAAKIPLTPIFTLGVGDTVSKKDQLIKDVISNEIAFLKNKFPVEVDLEAYKAGKRQVSVSIFHDGKTVASRQVSYTDGNFDAAQLIFELEATQVGFQHYVVEIKAIDGEYTLKNNRRSFYIEVLDSRNRILLLSGAPHPDISALKSVLEQDENVQVQSSLIENWDNNLKNTDLVVWHEPGIGFSDQLNQLLLKSKIPCLYFIGVNTPASVSQKLNIGLNYSSGNQRDEVQAGIDPGFDLFEISDELKSELPKFPPLIVRYGDPKLSAQNQVFLKQKLGSIQKKDALMFFGSKDQRKYGVFLGEGIWKWKMSNYLKAKNHALFNEFFQKLNQYLVQKENSSNLRVTLPKRFSKNEEVLIKAEFYNESMELVTKPEISFTLVDSKGKKSVFEFAVNGNLYLLPLGKLKSGSYSWTAQTTFSGKKYRKSGNFVVENIQIEKLDTKANHSLLNQISEQSKGKFYELKNYNSLIKELKAREDITSVSYEESSYDSLLDYIWLLLLLVLFLSSEWFLKRWYGLY